MKKIRMRTLMIWGVLAGAIVLSAPPSEAFRFMVTGDTRGSDNGVNAVILAEMAQAAIDECRRFYSGYR